MSSNGRKGLRSRHFPSTRLATTQSVVHAVLCRLPKYHWKRTSGSKVMGHGRLDVFSNVSPVCSRTSITFPLFAVCDSEAVTGK